MPKFHVTPQSMEMAYELLRVTLPFRRWKLPDGDLVEFHVTKHLDRCGDYLYLGKGRHRIRMSSEYCTGLAFLTHDTAHEMCHMRQAIHKPDDKAHHGAYFVRSAKAVCRVHGWDLTEFLL